jgi:hypothetical protein
MFLDHHLRELVSVFKCNKSKTLFLSEERKIRKRTFVHILVRKHPETYTRQITSTIGYSATICTSQTLAIHSI